jgi:hypothetical protein
VPPMRLESVSGLGGPAATRRVSSDIANVSQPRAGSMSGLPSRPLLKVSQQSADGLQREPHSEYSLFPAGKARVCGSVYAQLTNRSVIQARGEVPPVRRLNHLI